MNHFRRQISIARVVACGLLCAIAVVSTVKLSGASVGTITKADLSGAWQANVVVSGGGCGVGAMVVSFTLNSSGTATNAALVEDSSGCGAFTLTGQTFTITALNANGTGTATLTCGSGCALHLSIQVAPDRAVFNFADVADSGTFLGGEAIHQ